MEDWEAASLGTLELEVLGYTDFCVEMSSASSAAKGRGVSKCPGLRKSICSGSIWVFSGHGMARHGSSALQQHGTYQVRIRAQEVYTSTHVRGVGARDTRVGTSLRKAGTCTLPPPPSNPVGTDCLTALHLPGQEHGHGWHAAFGPRVPDWDGGLPESGLFQDPVARRPSTWNWPAKRRRASQGVLHVAWVVPLCGPWGVPSASEDTLAIGMGDMGAPPAGRAYPGMTASLPPPEL